jgi:hypothetical protein
MLTIRPPSLMCLIAAWVATKTARTLIAKVRSKSSRRKRSMGAIDAMPALLTRMSMPPNSVAVRSTAATTACASALSAWTATARTPSAFATRNRVGLVGLAHVGERHVRTAAREASDDRGADAPAAPGDEGTFVLE